MLGNPGSDLTGHHQIILGQTSTLRNVDSAATTNAHNLSLENLSKKFAVTRGGEGEEDGEDEVGEAAEDGESGEAGDLHGTRSAIGGEAFFQQTGFSDELDVEGFGNGPRGPAPPGLKLDSILHMLDTSEPATAATAIPTAALAAADAASTAAGAAVASSTAVPAGGTSRGRAAGAIASAAGTAATAITASLAPTIAAAAVPAASASAAAVASAAISVAATPAPGDCPAWCVSRAARSWACETLECQPCLDVCLAVMAYNSTEGDPAASGHQAIADPNVRAVMTSQQQSWTCPPTWPPQHLFVIFTLPRSASTTICSVINTLPDTYCASELINDEFVHRKDERALLHADPARFVQYEFEAAFADKRAAPCTWGFKAFDEHLTNATFLDWLYSGLGTALVLERHDGGHTADQHISHNPKADPTPATQI